MLSCVCAADLMQLWLCVKAWLHVGTLQLGLKGNKPSLRWDLRFHSLGATESEIVPSFKPGQLFNIQKFTLRIL